MLVDPAKLVNIYLSYRLRQKKQSSPIQILYRSIHLSKNSLTSCIVLAGTEGDEEDEDEEDEDDDETDEDDEEEEDDNKDNDSVDESSEKDSDATLLTLPGLSSHETLEDDGNVALIEGAAYPVPDTMEWEQQNQGLGKKKRLLFIWNMSYQIVTDNPL